MSLRHSDEWDDPVEIAELTKPKAPLPATAYDTTFTFSVELLEPEAAEQLWRDLLALPPVSRRVACRA